MISLINNPDATPTVSLGIDNIKFAENKSYGECVEAMLNFILEENFNKDGSSILKNIKSIKLYTELLL